MNWHRRYPSFHPTAQCVVHALKGLACRARVTPASSPAAPASRMRRSRRLYSTRAAAQVLLAPAEVTKNIMLFKMGPKRRYPAVPLAVYELVLFIAVTCPLSYDHVCVQAGASSKQWLLYVIWFCHEQLRRITSTNLTVADSDNGHNAVTAIAKAVVDVLAVIR